MRKFFASSEVVPVIDFELFWRGTQPEVSMHWFEASSIVPDDILRSILWFLVYVVSPTFPVWCLIRSLLDLNVLKESFSRCEHHRYLTVPHHPLAPFLGEKHVY